MTAASLLLPAVCGARLGAREIAGRDVACFTASSRTSDVAQSPRDGRVYVASRGGLLQYDASGKLSRVYTRSDGLPSHSIHELLISTDDSLWMATSEGVAVLSNSRITSYAVDNGLNDSRTYCLEEGVDGQIYIGTHRGVSVFDGSAFEPFNDTHEFSRRPTWDIHRSIDGTLWFAKENSLTHYLGKGEWETFQRDPFLPGEKDDLISNSLLCLATDSSGDPWIGTKVGLGIYDEGRWEHLFYAGRFFRGTGLKDSRIATLAFDDKGRLWIGHGNSKAHVGGVGASSLQGDAWRYFTVEDGLPDNRVHKVRATSDGKVWMATSRGVAALDEVNMTTIHTPGALPANHVLNVVAMGQGQVAVHTPRNVSVFAGGRPVSVPPCPAEDITGLTAHNGTLVVATKDHGLLYMAEGHWRVDPFFKDEFIASVGVQESGDLWVLHEKGLHIGNPGSWKSSKALSGYSMFQEPRIYPGPGDAAWITGVGKAGNVLQFAKGADKPSRVIKDIYQPYLTHVSHAKDGVSWMCSSDGFTNLSDGRAHDVPDGMMGWRPRVAVWDAAGRAWVGTRDHGVVCFDGDGWKQLTIEGNPLPREITGLCFESKNVLWVSTASEGAMRIMLRQ